MVYYSLLAVYLFCLNRMVFGCCWIVLFALVKFGVSFCDSCSGYGVRLFSLLVACVWVVVLLYNSVAGFYLYLVVRCLFLLWMWLSVGLFICLSVLLGGVVWVWFVFVFVGLWSLLGGLMVSLFGFRFWVWIGCFMV